MEKEILKKKFLDCDLSLHTIRCLNEVGLETVGKLCRMEINEFVRLIHHDSQTFFEVVDFIKDNRLSFGIEEAFEPTVAGDDEVERWVVENCVKRYDADMADRIFLAIRDIACDNEKNKADSNKVFVVLSEVVARFLAMNLHLITDNLGESPDFTIQDMAKMFHEHVRMFCMTKYVPEEEI